MLFASSQWFFLCFMCWAVTSTWGSAASTLKDEDSLNLGTLLGILLDHLNIAGTLRALYWSWNLAGKSLKSGRSLAGAMLAGTSLEPRWNLAGGLWGWKSGLNFAGAGLQPCYCWNQYEDNWIFLGSPGLQGCEVTKQSSKLAPGSQGCCQGSRIYSTLQGSRN